MMDGFKDCFLSIDSGATTARYILFRDPGAPILAGRTRGVNVTEKGAGALDGLFAAISRALPAGQRISAMGLALAGSGRPQVRGPALERLGSLMSGYFPGSSLFLFHDGQSALWAALESGVGVVVVSGTGSIAYGTDSSGAEARCGGWGKVVGDEGSAYWIAVRGIAAVMRAHDGRDQATGLAARLLECLALPCPDSLVSWVQDPSRTKEEVAALAREVAEAARAGDEAAADILEAAGDELARMGAAVLGRLSLGSAPRMGIGGSILRECAPVRRSFEASLIARRGDVRVVDSSLPAEVGTGHLLLNRIASGAAPDIPAFRQL